MENKKISVLIVNFRSDIVLEKCLASVFDLMKKIDFEVIVVNNDKKETLEKIRTKFTCVRIIEKNENLGFARAVNIGAKAAVGEILFVLNPDTVLLLPKTEEILLEFEREEKVGVLGVKTLDQSGKVQAWIAGVEKNFWDLLKNNLGMPESRKKWESSEKIETDWVAATAVFVRKNLFERLNGFDEKFFMYFEDVDFCKRIRALGFKVIYFPGFEVMHLGGASFSDKKEQKKNYYISQKHYFEKHARKWENRLVSWMTAAFYGLK
jgi:GT2 family glycosyltransferase